MADYFGPTSHVVIYVLINDGKDNVLALDSVTSDQNGMFDFQLRLPSFSNSSSSYKLEFMSQCRKEHNNFCTYSSASVPLDIENILDLVKLNKNLLRLANIYERLIQSNLQSNFCKNINFTNIENVEKLLPSGTDNDDIVFGLGGNEIICSGSGDDTIYSGLGSDIIEGGIGNDTIDGSYGNDLIYGGMSNDKTESNNGINLYHHTEQQLDSNN